MHLVKRALSEFEELSGLKPNYQKCSLFVTGVTDEAKSDRSQIMAMELKELPMRYLGVPLISNRLKTIDCENIKDRILKSVISWISKKLSYAGRVQLVVPVLHGIQANWSSIFILVSYLKKILHEVEEILRRFLWSGPDLKKNGDKVAWEDAYCPHKEGGLGVKDIVVWNKASMLGTYGFG